MSRTTQRNVWKGIGVSDGVVAGRVLRLHDGAPSLYRVELNDGNIEPEIVRLHRALKIAHTQLTRIKHRAHQLLGSEHAYIFDAHLAILGDRKLIEEVEHCIRHEQVNSEWAVKVVTDRLLGIYKQIADDYLRERGSDIEDVARRILNALAGTSRSVSRAAQQAETGRGIIENAVVVAADVMASTFAELDFNRVRAVVSDTGGWTSHAAIIARGLGVPAVVGARDLYRSSRTGDSILVDATHGRITLHPSAAELRALDTFAANSRNAANSHDAIDSHDALHAVSDAARHPAASSSYIRGDAEQESLCTLDATQIILRANVELPAEYASVERFGARGIGLYRSEFLWSQHNRMPTEDEQVAAYTEVARIAGADGATIRLFDFGGDKIHFAGLDPERNPALGLRAIRLGLRFEDVLRTQARSLLRVAHSYPLSVVLPMIADVGDVRRARRIIEEETAALTRQKIRFGKLRVGAMIEVPSAVLIIDRIAPEVDFMSLGTNDLVQYLLAVDRGNEAVAEWFRTLHPSVLVSIKRTLDAARAANTPVTICGEMAATPAYAFLLVGLGARDLSMSAASIPRVRRVIRLIDGAGARRIAAACLDCPTADDVEELVRTRLGSEYGHIFTPEMLPPAKRAHVAAK